MDIFIKITQFILSFSLLVIIHELGHYIFARIFGIRVEKFYLFFNPGFSLVKFKIGETEYGIGWIPFGGYVKIAGMIDESMDTEQMKQPAKPDEFRSKPAWQRLFVMLGGVIMNVVLAVIIYIGMSWAWGDKYIANEDIKYGYVFNDLAHQIGFEDGDRIISVGGKKIENTAMVFPEIVINNAPDVEILRNGERMTISIPQRFMAQMLESADFMQPRIPFIVAPHKEENANLQAGIMAGDSLIAVDGNNLIFFDEIADYIKANAGKKVELTFARDSAGVKVLRSFSSEVSDEGRLGIPVLSYASLFPVQSTHYGLVQAIPAGIKRTGTEISNYWKQVKLLFSPKTEAYKSLGGVITIGNIFPNFWSWEAFWSITAFLSVILAVMNILPIPGLDGGHVMFVLYEIITRRKPGEKFLETAQLAGIIILFGLILYATGNDIYRFFIK